MKKPEGLDWLLVLVSSLPSFRTEANTYQAPANPCLLSKSVKKKLKAKGPFGASDISA